MTRFSKLPARLLPMTAVHSRRSSTLVTAGTTFPFTQTLLVSYGTPGLVMLKATALDGILSVDIAGTLNGTPDTETVALAHTGSLVARSTKRWTQITQIKVDETQAGTLEAEGVGLGGEELYATTTLDSSLRVRLYRRRLGNPEIDAQGKQILERWVVYTNSLNVAVGDQFVIEGVTYEVEHDNEIWGQLRSGHHTEASVRRIS